MNAPKCDDYDPKLQKRKFTHMFRRKCTRLAIEQYQLKLETNTYE